MEKNPPGSDGEVMTSDEVLGWVAHELKTPLAAALMASSLLERELTSLGVPAVTVQRQERLGRQLARIDHLTNAILAFARLQAAGRPIVTRPVRLGEVLTTSVEFYRDLHPTRTLTLSLADPELVVQGDPELLRQIVDNLISNALRHGGPRAEVRVALERQDGRAVVRVTDNGPGMSADLIAQLGVGSQASDAHLPRPFGISGLGLHIARRLAHAHHAQLTARSVPGSGTTLALSLALDGAR